MNDREAYGQAFQNGYQKGYEDGKRDSAAKKAETTGKLIDADALKQALLEKGFFPAIVQRAIERAPAVDAVEVVRCKDRGHRKDPFICPMCYETYGVWNDDGYTEWETNVHDYTDDDGFCHIGERGADNG